MSNAIVHINNYATIFSNDLRAHLVVSEAVKNGFSLEEDYFMILVKENGFYEHEAIFSPEHMASETKDFAHYKWSNNGCEEVDLLNLS